MSRKSLYSVYENYFCCRDVILIRNGERQRETVATCLLNLPLINRYNESIEELPDIGFELPELIK